jgi:hypothetical protein
MRAFGAEWMIVVVPTTTKENPMTSIFKALLASGATALVLGLGAAGPASAWGDGAIVPDGPDRSVIDPNDSAYIPSTPDRWVVPDGPDRSVVDPNVRSVIDPNVRTFVDPNN